MPSSFDDHIREQFQHYQPSVPADMWSRIQGEKDRRRPVAWLFPKKTILAVALLLLVAGGGAYWYQQSAEQKPLSTETNQNSGASTHRSESGEPNSTASTTGGSSEMNHTKSNIATTSTNPHTSTDQPSSANTNQANNNTELQPSATINQKEVSGSSTTAASNQRTTKHLGPVLDQTASTQQGTTLTHKRKNLLTTTSIEATAGTEMIDNNSSFNRNKKRQTQKGKYKVNIVGASTDESAEETDAATAQLLEQQSLQQQIRSLQLLELTTHDQTALKQKQTPRVSIPCPERIGPGNRKYLELYVSPDYAFRSFNDTASSAYLQQRKASTRYQSAFSAGLRYTRVFANAMSFRTGVNFSQINEKFTYVQGNIVQVTYILNAAGDTIGSYSSTATRYKTTHNRYKTIDIPLLVGYEWGDGRLHANINAGLIVNVYSWQKGDVLDVNNKPISITTGESSSPYQYKTNIGLGFTGSASIYYKLTDRWQLLAEPYFRYNLSSATKSEITLKQKFTTIGLRLGLRFDF